MKHPTFYCPFPLATLALGLLLTGFQAQADTFSEASQLLRIGKPAEALAKIEQGPARDPQLRFLKGVILTETGKATDAIAVFSKLTEDFPELPEPYNNLAVLYAGQNQFDKARAALEMAIRTNPSYATAHENLGDIYAKLASQAYSKALQLDASNTGVQPKLALIRNLFASSAAPGKAGKPAAPASAATAATTTAVAPAPVPPTPAPIAAPAPAPVATVPPPSSKPAVAPAAAPVVPERPTAAAVLKTAEQERIEAALQAWAKAWTSRNVVAYLAAYGKDFDPAGNQSRKEWQETRRSRILGKSHITVRLHNVAISVNGNRATAQFRQEYSADGLNVASRKTLDFVKTGERWLIVREATGG